MSNAITLANKYPEKRIVIHIVDLKGTIALDKILNLLVETKNLYLELYNIEDLLTISSQLSIRECPNKKIFYHHPVTTFNMIYFLMQQNVSDIVLGEPIVFNLTEVRKMIPKDSGVIIRANPAEGRPQLYNLIKNVDDGLYHFWVTPQATYLYDNYIDIFDLSDSNEIRESTLITVFQKKEYPHSLRSLCKNVDNDIPCGMFSEEDLRYRLTCKQRCIQGTCHRCKIISDMYLRVKDLTNGKSI